MNLNRTLELPFSPKSAERVARSFGPLAGYFLNARTLRVTGRSSERHPPLPADPGACWPVIAVAKNSWLNFLEPAFPLPLRWIAGQQVHDQRLPQTLHECAEQVRVALSVYLNGKDAEEAANYRIWFPDPTEAWPDLSDLAFPAESAFASLALGYFSLLNKVTPFGATWASVQWDNQLLPVEELAKKVDAALRWQAQSFFVAAKQSLDELSEDQKSIIKRLSAKPGSPTVGLSEYFVSGLVEPDANAPEACITYHAAIRELDASKAAGYYATVLAGHIAKKCRENILVGSIGRESLPTTMITIVTHNIEPVSVMIGLLGIRRVLLLYTQNQRQMFDKANELCRQIRELWPDGCCAEPAGFCFDDTSKEFPTDFFLSLRGQIESFLEGTEDTDVVFDIDRGTTMHKLALCKLIRPNHWLTTLTHHWQNGKIKHGTERLKLWRVRDDWMRPFSAIDRLNGTGGSAD